MAKGGNVAEGEDLYGRCALVTGGSGGIGGAISLSLAAAGADVALTYAGHRAPAEGIADQIRALGQRALVLPADLRQPEVAAATVEATRAELGSVDVLVANAGVGQKLSWDQVELDLWDETMAVNLRAPWLMTRAVLPDMISRGFGRILFLSSIAALNGGVIGPHYAASKAGLHGLMHHLAGRVAGNGVTVNTIAPALIAGTGFVAANPDNPGTPVPVGRLGTADDVAAMVLAMLTNSYLTNKVITLDGGIYPD